MRVRYETTYTQHEDFPDVLVGSVMWKRKGDTEVHRTITNAWISTVSREVVVKFSEEVFCTHCNQCIAQHYHDRTLKWWRHPRAGWKHKWHVAALEKKP